MSSTEQTGRIVDWDPRKNFGFLHDGTNRVFLHERDFVKPHKPPERGDNVTFFYGTDITGRTVAKDIRIRQARAGLRPIHGLALAALLIGPSFALHRLSASIDYRILLGAGTGLSLFTFGIYGLDKRRAREGDYRVPEKVLHFLALAGGWPGAFLGQRFFHHKSAKTAFLLIFWAIIALHQFAALDYALDFRLSRGTKALLQRPPATR